LIDCSGYAAGAEHRYGGSGSNFLCLPKDPDWDTFRDGFSGSGHIAGVEYEISSGNNVFSHSNTGGARLGGNLAPCAVCSADLRSTVLMIPAKTQCPDAGVRNIVAISCPSLIRHSELEPATFAGTERQKSPMVARWNRIRP